MLSINAIEVTNFCNLSCLHCPHSIATYPKGYVSIENFTKAVDYTQRPAFGLSLCGEPLLHPQICELIKIAKQSNREVSFATNGILLTEDMCHKLIEAKISSIEVSIHTEKSLQGYKTLWDINELTGAKLVIIGNILSCYDPEFKTWMKNIQIEEKHLSGLRLAPMHNWALDPHNPQNSNRAQCVFINTNVCVMKWDGKIHACCFDFNGTNYIGEIDDFPNLQHNPANYKLCDTCSPAWLNGTQSWWWYITSFPPDYWKPYITAKT